MTLADAVEAQGYRLVIDPQPWTRPDTRGNPPDPATFGAIACDNHTIACVADSWDHAYAVAHEIAEDRRGHAHTAEVYCEQANILAAWCRTLAPTRDGDA